MKIRTATLHELIKEIRFQQKRLKQVMTSKGVRDGLIDSCKRLEIILAILTVIAQGKPIEVIPDGEEMET